MPIYSIEQIMSAKARFTEKPYPDFSIANVCRKLAPTALVRGETAYVPKRATNADDAVRKTVQGALNKLSEENFDEIAGELECDMLLEPAAVKIFVALTFEKALNEPTFCRTYARLCYSLARYEVHHGTLQQQSADVTAPSPLKVQSQFRSAIVERAQLEFEETTKSFAAPPKATADEIAELQSQFVRRKKANMKFVGQLYREKVLSGNVMLTVIGKLMGAAPHFPTEIEIEVLMELLENIGKLLEEKLPDFVEDVFSRFNDFLGKKPSYTPRIHFKIMDMVDHRRNNWETRDAARHQAEGTSTNASRAPSTRATASKPSVASPALATPTGRKQLMFPATPQPQPSPSANDGRKNEPVKKEPMSWTSVVAGNKAPAAHRDPSTGTAPSSTAASPSTLPPPKPERPPTAPKITLDKAIDELLRGWSQDVKAPLGDWRAHFAAYNLTPDALTSEIICKLTVKACSTTKNYAQAEAAGFLACGLQLKPADTLLGLANTLKHAVEEGIIEDSPKFNQRLVRVLEDLHRSSSTGIVVQEGDTLPPLPSETVTAIACDLAEVLALALVNLIDLDFVEDPVADVLLPVWKKLPSVPVDEESLTKTIVSKFSGAHPTKAVAAADLLAWAKSSGMISGSAVSRFMATAPPAAAIFVGLLEGKGFTKAVAE